MDSVIKIIGIVIICIGILYLLRPQIFMRILLFFNRGRRLYFAGLLRFVLAVVFFLGARECDVTWVIVSFGILFLISGLLIFTLGLERLRGIIEWYEGQPIMLLRVVALIALAAGAIIVYAA